MAIRIGRTLPPAAAPIPIKDVLKALPACFRDDTGGSNFEDEIKREFGQQYCLLVSSGKAALVLILRALSRLYPGRNEVLIPAFTCYSVPAAIKKAGLKIRLCDTGSTSLDFDKNQLRKIIQADKKEKKILCVLVTHLFGVPADFSSIKEIVGNKIPIIEDAAQAMGQEIDNTKIGTLGDAGFFSLGRGKAVSTMEGGIIVTSRNDLGTELLKLSQKNKNYSISAKLKLAVKTILTTLLQHPLLFWLPKALPFLRLGDTIYEENFSIYKMSDFQRKLAYNWRKRLKKHQEARSVNITFWHSNLPEKFSLICSKQKLTSQIRLPVQVLSAKGQDRLCLKSEKKGCGVMPTYPTPINDIAQIAGEFSGQKFPNAKNLANSLITLPVHEYVQESDRIHILNILNA